MARGRRNRRRYRRRRLRRYKRRRLRQQDEQKSLIAEAGTDPIWAYCPNCDEEILTTIEKSFSHYQYLIASGLFFSLVGFICCCSCTVQRLLEDCLEAAGVCSEAARRLPSTLV